MKKLKLRFLAVEIEWHWWFISRIRKKGNSLLNGGLPFSSQRFYHLNRRLSSHGAKAVRAQADYEKLERRV